MDASAPILLLIIAVLLPCSLEGDAIADPSIPVEENESPFAVVRVVDEETGRGVPLVKLTFPNHVTYLTDSAGIAAIREPSLAQDQVFVRVESDGYLYPENTVFGPGLLTRLIPGYSQTIKMRRAMAAQRLYRLTGEGIYRDSRLAGAPIPHEIGSDPFKAKILGQDTVSAAVYRGRIFWIWGDTIGPDYWNFQVAAATSSLSDDPERAINYEYFTDEMGRSRSMLPLNDGGLVWIEGMVVMNDLKGQERLIALYCSQDGLKPPKERGLALFDDESGVFKRWVLFTDKRHHQSSHPFLHQGYWYFYPSLRVPNDWHAIQEESQWEKRSVQLPKAVGGASCVVWNHYRNRWILLTEHFGSVYYAEADDPEGPYGSAVQIIRHDNYNFYNVTTHTFLNREDGRVIYIEGTYTDSFVKAPAKTPRYQYNQVLYKLELDDPRLKPAHQAEGEILDESGR